MQIHWQQSGSPFHMVARQFFWVVWNLPYQRVPYCSWHWYNQIQCLLNCLTFHQLYHSCSRSLSISFSLLLSSHLLALVITPFHWLRGLL
jgi:hypothetical protein